MAVAVAQDQNGAVVQAPGAGLPTGQPLAPAQQPAGQTATAPAQQTTGQPLAPAQLPAGQAAGAPAPAALPTRLVPSRMPAAISIAPTAAASGGQAMTPTAATQLVPGIVQGTIAAQVSDEVPLLRSARPHRTVHAGRRVLTLSYLQQSKFAMCSL